MTQAYVEVSTSTEKGRTLYNLIKTDAQIRSLKGVEIIENDSLMLRDLDGRVDIRVAPSNEIFRYATGKMTQGGNVLFYPLGNDPIGTLRTELRALLS